MNEIARIVKTDPSLICTFSKSSELSGPYSKNKRWIGTLLSHKLASY